MNIDIAAVCDHASTSEGKLNLLGIFQEINPPAYPFILAAAWLVISFRVQPTEFGESFRVRVHLIDPMDRTQQLFNDNIRIDPAIAVRRDHPAIHNHLQSLSGMPFVIHGEHRFSVAIEGGDRREVSIFANPAGSDRRSDA